MDKYGANDSRIVLMFDAGGTGFRFRPEKFNSKTMLNVIQHPQNHFPRQALAA